MRVAAPGAVDHVDEVIGHPGHDTITARLLPPNLCAIQPLRALTIG
jgi:hypothetical protein